jgi:glycosyltransferase involved in cell wall biosynthesis
VLRNRCADGSVGNSALLYVEAMVQRLMGNYEKVDRIIAPSQFMAESVKSLFPAEKVRVIHNGIDISKLSAYNKDEGYVLYIGRLSREKGIKTLVEAYRRHEIHMPLKVCGTGPLLEELSSKPIPGVKFLGYKTGEELQTLIAEASFVVVPSEWYENCPMSVLEAMAYGKPVIASRIGGIPELVTDQLTGLLHELGNVDDLAGCINQLAKDISMRARFGVAARLRAENYFSLEQHNTALMAVYHELVED